MAEQVVQLDEKADAQGHQRQRHAQVNRREDPAAREQQSFDRLFHPVLLRRAVRKNEFYPTKLERIGCRIKRAYSPGDFAGPARSEAAWVQDNSREKTAGPLRLTKRRACNWQSCMRARTRACAICGWNWPRSPLAR